MLQPPSPGAAPEKGVGRLRGGLGAPDKTMGLPPGATGLGEKGSKPPHLAPGSP